jgi:hypothetical protein
MNMSYDALSLDQMMRNLTFHFGLYALYDPLLDQPASFNDDIVRRRGEGRPLVCQRSGNIFPAGRMKKDGDGRMVGDIFYTTGTPRIREWRRWR